MKKTHLLSLLVLATVPACGGSPEGAETPSETAAKVDPPPPVQAPQQKNPIDMASEGTTEELLAALAAGNAPVFVVLRPGTSLGDGKVVAAEEHPVARALRLAEGRLVVELMRDGDTRELTVDLANAQYMKGIDHGRLGIEIDRAARDGFGEVLDFDLDEAARRAADPMGILPAGPADFDCIARFNQISASRDFVPFPLTNCSTPQDPVGDPERIADATKAKKVADNLYSQALAEYQNAQRMIALLQQRLVEIQNAYLFILHDPYYKEYNLTHFKDIIHGRKSYNDRFERAEQLLKAAAQAAIAQIQRYSLVPPPSLADSKSQANRIVARKWNCVLGSGLLNNGGRSGSTVVGVSLETVGAPYLNIQVMLDDNPPLPHTQGWGGVFGITPTPTLPTDVSRLSVASFVPVRASVGLPIVMFRFQPLDAKKTRPVGKACNLRAGIVQ
ncbi:MAG: hypothetical protein JST00_45690 [Deltaproteobacteria bacterium]|nr:hypothetical protein [Deltaproteobacteria bacterium]